MLKIHEEINTVKLANIQKRLDAVSPRDREIYHKRESGIKLQKIADEYGISMERARQIHKHVWFIVTAYKNTSGKLPEL